MKPQSTKTVPASEAKVHFGEILNTCVYGNTPITITKHDKPVAVLVKIEDWQAKNKSNDNDDDNVPELHKRVMAMKKEGQEFLKKYPPKKRCDAVEIARMGRRELERRADKWIKKS